MSKFLFTAFYVDLFAKSKSLELSDGIKEPN